MVVTLRRTAQGVLSGLAVAAALMLGAGSAQAALSPTQLDNITDTYLFHTSLPTFRTIHGQHPYSGQIDWSSDGCSHVPDDPFGFTFLPACQRHDFGYRNYKRQSRFTEPHRKEIDDNFRSDMYSICAGNLGCQRTADVYYWGVRKLGGVSRGTADAVAGVTG